MLKTFAQSIMGIGVDDAPPIGGSGPVVVDGGGGVVDDERTVFPTVVRACLEFFHKNGVLVVGLMRVCGSHHRIASILGEFSSGRRTSFEECCDPHVVAGVLKQYIRTLKDPLVPAKMYNAFLAASSIDREDMAVRELQRLLSLINPVDCAILGHVGLLLRRIADHCDVTRMSAENCSLIFGPTLLRTPDDLIPTNAAAHDSSSLQSWLVMSKHHNRFVYLLMMHTTTMLPDLAPLSSFEHHVPSPSTTVMEKRTPPSRVVRSRLSSCLSSDSATIESFKCHHAHQSPEDVPSHVSLVRYVLTNAPKVALRSSTLGSFMCLGVKTESDSSLPPTQVYATYTCDDATHPWKTERELWRVEETKFDGYHSIRSLLTHMYLTVDPDSKSVVCCATDVGDDGHELFSFVRCAPPSSRKQGDDDDDDDDAPLTSSDAPMMDDGAAINPSCHADATFSIVSKRCGEAICLDRDGRLSLGGEGEPFSICLKVAFLQSGSSSTALSAKLDGTTLRMKRMFFGFVLRAALWETFYVEFLMDNLVSIGRYTMVSGMKLCTIKPDGAIGACAPWSERAGKHSAQFILCLSRDQDDGENQRGKVDGRHRRHPFNRVKLATKDGMAVGMCNGKLSVCVRGEDVPSVFDLAFFPLNAG